MEEANKLIGLGKKHLVTGKVVEAVNALQEACGLLAKKYGDTADECGEAFYWCGKALLDLARMENSVLGNALQGVPDEDEEEKPKDSNVELESADDLDEKTRDELRVQVYDAMAEKEESAEKDGDEKKDESTEKTNDAKEGTSEEGKDGSTEKDEPLAKQEQTKDEKTTNEKLDEPEQSKEKPEETKEETEEKTCENDKAKDEKPAEKDQTDEKTDAESTTEKAEQSPAEEKEDSGKETKADDKPSAEQPSESDENKENVAAEMETDQEVPTTADKPEEAEEGDEEEEMEGDEETEETDGEKEKAEGEDTAEKGSEDEEVGNLQLAWEMLEVAKVIYKRKETKEDQLMAAQTHLKLGEVSAESGNYTQAIEDFQECLKLQLKHLEPDSRLLAETHYQLGLTYSLDSQYKQAIEELDRSISVIKSRLEKLQELLDKAEGPDALPEERKELEELKALLPEIQEKVEDSTEGLKTASADAEAVKGVLDGSAAAESGDNLTSTKDDASSEQATPATDISHLVRKKRKPEESPVKEVKKPKQDEGEVEEPPKNGTHTNGQTNGHSKDMEVQSN